MDKELLLTFGKKERQCFRKWIFAVRWWCIDFR